MGEHSIPCNAHMPFRAGVFYRRKVTDRGQSGLSLAKTLNAIQAYLRSWSPLRGFCCFAPTSRRVRPNPNSRLPRTPRRGADCGPHGRQSGVLMCSLRTGCPRTTTTDLCHDPLPVGECGGALRGSPRQLRHHLRDSNPANQNRRTRCTSARTAPVKILKCHLGCPRG